MSGRVPRVIIIGAGMSGICVAAQLKRSGVEDLTILEKAGRLGGTWRDNTYPGLTCDVPSAFYQYSFALNPSWSRAFSPGAEIHEYFQRTAHELGVAEHVVFGQQVTSADFSDGLWHVRTTDGCVRLADFLVSATGVLHHPRWPEIKGSEDFSGPAFHSARWDHAVPLAGRRVAVIGSGSTGVQIVSALGGVASHVTMFQRTPQWVLPLPHWPAAPPARYLRRQAPHLTQLEYHATKRLFGLFATAVTKPGWQRSLIGAACRAHLSTVRDPELRRILTPQDEPMCKRLVMSSSFYRVVQRRDVDVVATPIDHLDPQGVVTEDGSLHEVDVIVYATGFDAHAYLRPIELTGVDGLTLTEAWRDGPRGYRTVALPGFPNFFMLMGPHSPVGNFSLVSVAEAQAHYIVRWIERWRDREFSTAAPLPSAARTFNERLRAALPRTIWATGCDSWYLGRDGLPEVWPWTPQQHETLLREDDRANYLLDGAG